MKPWGFVLPAGQMGAFDADSSLGAGCRQCQAALAKGGPPAQGLGTALAPGRHQFGKTR